ncbi:hypothetical protein EDB89DRAFT_1910190 [Lactarius sanguifluus]|nr:hypothetical protein EDB89DRAFT_1910190 [Lactarius sanguifluus]
MTADFLFSSSLMTIAGRYRGSSPAPVFIRSRSRTTCEERPRERYIKLSSTHTFSTHAGRWIIVAAYEEARSPDEASEYVYDACHGSANKSDGFSAGQDAIFGEARLQDSVEQDATGRGEAKVRHYGMPDEAGEQYVGQEEPYGPPAEAREEYFRWGVGVIAEYHLWCGTAQHVDSLDATPWVYGHRLTRRDEEYVEALASRALSPTYDLIPPTCDAA